MTKRRLTFKKPPDTPAAPAVQTAHTRIVSHSRRGIHPPKIAPARKKRRIRIDVAIGIAVAIVAIIVLAVLAHVYRQKRIEARFEAHALGQAHARAHEAYDRISPYVTQVGELIEAADRHIAAAKEAVQFVTGIPYEAHVAPPASAPEPDEKQPTSAPRPPTRAPIGGLSIPGRETSGGRDQPAGIPSRAELDRQRGRIGQPAAAEPEAAAPEAASAPSAAEDPRPALVAQASPPPQAAAPVEIVGVARGMTQQREQIADRMVGIVEFQTQAEEKRAESLRAHESAVAFAAVAAIENLVLRIELVAAEAAEAAERIGADAVRAETLRAAEVARREAREAEEQRQREAEALRQRIADERQRAAELYENTRPRSRLYAFADVLADLEQELPSFGTDEGRKALGLHIERFQRLTRQHEHLVRNLNEKPFRWGWGATAVASKDVLSADAHAVRIPGATVPWSEVSLPQMLKFLDHYGRDPRRRLSERAEGELNTAILLEEFGMRDAACERAREAVQIAESIRETAHRLLPDCF